MDAVWSNIDTTLCARVQQIKIDSLVYVCTNNYLTSTLTTSVQLLAKHETNKQALLITDLLFSIGESTDNISQR